MESDREAALDGREQRETHSGCQAEGGQCLLVVSIYKEEIPFYKDL